MLLFNFVVLASLSINQARVSILIPFLIKTVRRKKRVFLCCVEPRAGFGPATYDFSVEITKPSQ